VAARATVQHQRDCVSELLGDMSCIRRADAAKTVGGRCGNAVTTEDEQSRQQRVRDRVSGNAQAHAVLAAGHDIEHGRGAWQYQRQRARPKGLRERFRACAGLSRPARQQIRAGQMYDDGMVGGSPLDDE
jgi:hypothetical protein